MTRRRHREGGYALLLVCAMAASIAVMLYMEIPRVAFEAQRDKEQLLIDRGEQYTRAVQLYVRKFNRFPADIAALENTQSVRFLRKQYTDPMTGKSEWRLIHVGPGGVFTDSLVHKPKKDQNAPQTFITELQQIGGGGGPAVGEGVNLATRRRPSDGPNAQSDPFNTPSGGAGGGLPQSGQTPINGPVMVLPDGRIVAATPNGQPAGQPATGTNGQPGQGQMPSQGGQMPNGVGVQNSTGQYGVGQVANGIPSGFQNQANGVPGPPPNGAANLINQILTTPRPGGLNGLDTQQGGAFGQQNQGGAFGQPGQGGAFGTPIQASSGGQVIGGGIAGVASKAEREGIKLYGERSSYHEWEFVYDMSKDAMRGGGAQGGIAPQPGQQGQGQPGFGQPGSVPGITNGITPGNGQSPGGFPGAFPRR